MTLPKAARRLALLALALLAPALASAVEVHFVPVAEDVYAHVGDTGGQDHLQALRAVLGAKADGTVPTLPTRCVGGPDERLEPERE